MCDAKPGQRCAADTRAQRTATLTRYQEAHPDGPPVDPLAAAQAANTPISVPNPDDPTDMPIYEGPAGAAGEQLIPGTYEAEHLHDGGSYRLDITPKNAQALSTSTYDYTKSLETWDSGELSPQEQIAGRVAVYTNSEGHKLVGTVAVNPDGHYPHVTFTDGRHARLDGQIELVDEGTPTGGLENVPLAAQNQINATTPDDTRDAIIEASQNPERRAQASAEAIRHLRANDFDTNFSSSKMSDQELIATHPDYGRQLARHLTHSGKKQGAYWAWKEGRTHPDDPAYEEIWQGKRQGFSEEKVRANLREDKQTLADLEANRIRPSKVIGTGYKNPRKVALEYLHRSIARNEEAIASRGRSLSVNQANVDYRKRTEHDGAAGSSRANQS